METCGKAAPQTEQARWSWIFWTSGLVGNPLGLSCAIQSRYAQVREIPAATGQSLGAMLEVLNNLGSGVATILWHRDGASVDGCYAGVTILFPSHSSRGVNKSTVFPLLVTEAVSRA